MTPIHVVGIGLEGLQGLAATVQQILHSATLLVGSDRHLQLIPEGDTPRLSLGNFNASLKAIQNHLDTTPNPQVVILTSGDPLFYGLGRWLLEVFTPDQLTFHPHLSAVQLAFSRLKLPWQDAVIYSAHGRDLAGLVPLLQRGVEKIAIYTDGEANIAAISRLYQALQVPVAYRAWVCQALGSAEEAILPWDLAQPVTGLPPVHPLNLVVLLRQPQRLPPREQPILGLGDDQFFTFEDRPSLMTKREVRVLVLAELALTGTVEIVWDIGAGTGSVAVEIARLAPQATVYAIEKTAIGFQLIERNRKAFGLTNLIPLQGTAPQCLRDLPPPNRVFIGGSGAQLLANLDYCWCHLKAGGRLVLAIATLEHQGQVLRWCQTHQINPQVLQVQLSRSVPLGQGHRLHPLNPVTLITLPQG
ncbi:bifunctional cobalt precorrin-6y C5-methyltransferase / C15-methyltransferase (decarboxylating) CbiET [Thermosynechococcus sp. NK55a]|uniref:bifunctional cobalt-precorrin-7 (C(5))-methyltransferase/cobalt-precorrin-6B (C(15))-methyltransferase n=1 Tax=unclassified Thermosynechococcus TaxID=2622553 RepID=UPI0003D7FB5A|nr:MULTISPECIES: bifunctional cobalt-precorrin-7 (C(5))-methyltransferase/cobalt-precorrin-6B (C(15))-methyltransferase [unclassified Thermosynechococcus]AHB87612.1 bifunctional cobalt precorrin-6y C5-methyltransferase / C15-methyltransferase (decarboxylating) CbiET [Thermosynechococcus sp. NK55a]HIK23335.1 bifunctional cobalt-precorrin-7 (C(5))-methyltransferase/cobalt-precorrin-6B (C(15))-methyltransferase [Thermosynechococcus sp. M3746_W2019_013]